MEVHHKSCTCKYLTWSLPLLTTLLSFWSFSFFLFFFFYFSGWIWHLIKFAIIFFLFINQSFSFFRDIKRYQLYVRIITIIIMRCDSWKGGHVTLFFVRCCGHALSSIKKVDFFYYVGDYWNTIVSSSKILKQNQENVQV